MVVSLSSGDCRLQAVSVRDEITAIAAKINGFILFWTKQF
jgi:hypothetical protein